VTVVARGRTARRLHPAWIVAAVAFLALVGAAGFRAAPSVLMVPITDEFGWSRSVLSAAVGINLLLFGLTAPFAAALMERFGIRRVTTIALTVVAAGVGILLAIGGMYEMLIPFLILLGSIIPPIGGVIVADYWVHRQGRYPLLQSVQLPRFNWSGLAAYAIGAVVAYASPWIAPLVGITVSAVVYIALTSLCKRQSAADSVTGQ